MTTDNPTVSVKNIDGMNFAYFSTEDENGNVETRFTLQTFPNITFTITGVEFGEEVVDPETGEEMVDMEFKTKFATTEMEGLSVDPLFDEQIKEFCVRMLMASEEHAKQIVEKQQETACQEN